MIEKLRIPLTRLFAATLVVILVLYESAWEVEGPFVAAILFLIGCLLVGIASLGRLWCSLYIAGYKTNVLVTEGPYSLCRNPLYVFSLVGVVGLGFVSETITLPIVLFIAFMIYYPLVIRSEEKELFRLHKDQFAAYRSRVPRLIPRWSNLQEPEEYVVKPIIYKKHLFDALWFVWLVGIIELIEALHELHLLPVMFALY